MDKVDLLFAAEAVLEAGCHQRVTDLAETHLWSALDGCSRVAHGSSLDDDAAGRLFVRSAALAIRTWNGDILLAVLDMKKIFVDLTIDTVAAAGERAKERAELYNEECRGAK